MKRRRTPACPEAECYLRETVTRFQKTISNQNFELQELKRLVTRLALADAALTERTRRPTPSAPDNVVTLRLPSDHQLPRLSAAPEEHSAEDASAGNDH